jgi:DNA-binding transcriptional ArsR family regulator
MSFARMTPEVFELIAERFKAFAEPNRLQILHTLRLREHTVSQLAKETGIGQANLSKHLQQLTACGLVSRRKAGLFTHYSLADRDVLKLCDLMCGRLERETKARKKALDVG